MRIALLMGVICTCVATQSAVTTKVSPSWSMTIAPISVSRMSQLKFPNVEGGSGSGSGSNKAMLMNC